MAVAFRRSKLLPLNDCLYAIQATIPYLTRPSLHRGLRRHGISRLREVSGDKFGKQVFEAYGRYLPAGKEQTHTDKSLNEINALGRHRRRQRGYPNSSAQRQYRIVGDTMRGLMGTMRLTGMEKFAEAMQDRMGEELARQRGLNAKGLSQECASLRGQKLATTVELMSETPRHAMLRKRFASGAVNPGRGGKAIDATRNFRRAAVVQANCRWATTLALNAVDKPCANEPKRHWPTIWLIPAAGMGHGTALRAGAWGAGDGQMNVNGGANICLSPGMPAVKANTSVNDNLFLKVELDRERTMLLASTAA